MKKGDRVEMVNCGEATFLKNKKVWICKTDSFLDKCIPPNEVVFLEGFVGHFLCEFLKSKTIGEQK